MTSRPRTIPIGENRVVLILSAATLAWPIVTTWLYLMGQGFVALAELFGWLA